MGKLEIMLRQYEFLRKEIVQCIYLRQAAVLGIFTTIVAGMGFLFAERDTPIPVLALQLGVVGIAFLVNAFGSLYLHEQHRNRRACQFNLILERLITKAAISTKVFPDEDDVNVCPIIAWENFLMYSEECKRLNGPFYIARYLGVALPILVFSVPLIVVTSSLNLNLEHYNFWHLFPSVLSFVSVCLLIGAGLLEASQREKPSVRCRINLSSRRLRQILTVIYISPLFILGVYFLIFALRATESTADTSFINYLLALLCGVSVLLGCWSTYVFFYIMKWLGESKKGSKEPPQKKDPGAAQSNPGKDTQTPEPGESGVGQWMLSYCERIAGSDSRQLMLSEWAPFTTWKDNDAVERAGDND